MVRCVGFTHQEKYVQSKKWRFRIFPNICAMVKSRVFLGMGNLPPLMTESLDHSLLYGNNGSLDHGTFGKDKFLETIL